MTFSQLLQKYNGRYVEVAGSANAKFQCVDWVNLYIREVLGLPIIEWTNAVDFPSKASGNYEYIKNTPTGVPEYGDLVVWKPSPGHIAIFIEGNANKFKSADQNFPVGSPVHVQDHTYLNVTGWLRVKGNTPPDNDLIRRADAFVAVCTSLGQPVDKDIVLADIERLKKLEDLLREREKQIEILKQEIDKMSVKMKELEDDRKILENENEQQQRRLSDFTREFVDVQKQLEELQKIKPMTDYSILELILKIVKKIFGKGG